MSHETFQINKGSRVNDVVEQITLAINGIRFGSVEIVIHDGKVVQIERKEKLRFENKPTLTTKS